MGELIKKIGEIHIASNAFDIEMNEATTPDDEMLVHIQNKNGRFLLPESEFLEIATLILQARDHLKKYKSL